MWKWLMFSMVFLFALTGVCGDCLMSQMTLKAGIERAIMEDAPGIKGVESVGFP